MIGLTDLIVVSAGDSHACALLPGGSVKCWGDHFFGQLGKGTFDYSYLPVERTGL